MLNLNRKWLIPTLAIVGVLLVATVLWPVNKTGQPTANSLTKTITAYTNKDISFTIEDSTTTATYISNGFGFSLKYPRSWEIDKDVTFESGPDRGMVFSVNFVDPERERDIFIGLCLENSNGGWDKYKDLTPTRAECAPIIDSLSSTEKEEKRFGGYLPPINLFVRVYESDIPLKDWLMFQYNMGKGSELWDYAPGKEIELSGEHGYFSDTGCCAGIDNAYVIKKGRYIYEFGSNEHHTYELNTKRTSIIPTLIEQYKDGFQLFPVKENTASPQVDATTLNEMISIDKYCKAIDRSPAGQSFELAHTKNTTESKWARVPSLAWRGSYWGNDVYRGANAEVNQGAILFVKTSSFATTTLGDWWESNDYCFREDGTLAKVEGTFSTAHRGEGGVRVFRDLYFDVIGVLISSSTRVRDLRDPGESENSYQYPEMQIYNTVKQLPFFDLVDTVGDHKWVRVVDDKWEWVKK